MLENVKSKLADILLDIMYPLTSQSTAEYLCIGVAAYETYVHDCSWKKPEISLVDCVDECQSV